MFYVSSKLKHAQMWKDKQAEGWAITSSWIHGEKIEDKAELEDMWETYFQEVEKCLALILYVEKGEILKGALIEVGMALALGKRIFVVFPEGTKAELEKQVGTWIWDANVICGSSLDIAS